MTNDIFGAYDAFIEGRVYGFGIVLRTLLEAFDFLGITRAEAIWIMESSDAGTLLSYIRQADNLKAAIFHQRSTD